MKKLWLNAFTASLILGAVSFSAGVQAGDHHRGGHGNGRGHGHHGYEGHGRGHDDRGDRHERHCDNGRRYHHVAWHDYRPVYRPVYYSPTPIYRERDRYYDDDIHGSITVGF